MATTTDTAPPSTSAPTAVAVAAPAASTSDGPSTNVAAVSDGPAAVPAVAADGPADGTTAAVAPEKKAAESTNSQSPSTAAKGSTSTADEKAAEQQQAKQAAPVTPAPKAAASSAPKASPKKRRKRGGLTGLFVAMGCISSDEFDDDVPSKPKAAAKPTAASKPAPKTTTNAANGSTSTAKDAPNTTVVAAAAGGTAAAAATGTAVVAGSAANKSGDSVQVVPSSEPTTPPLDETAGLTSGAVQAPGSGSEIIQQHMHHHNNSEQHLATADGATRTDSGGYTDLSDSDGDDVGHQEMLYEEDFEDEEDRLIAQGGIGIPLDENGNPAPLLPAIHEIDTGRKCLVLDLDETLLHSSFKMLPSADYIVPVEIESQTHNVYVIKRPGVDHFLQEMGKIYEIVVFTASLSKYADPVLDMLDVGRVVRHRLFRESCYNHKGNFVKDLSQLGRDMSTAIIIDNSPASYIFHPNNAVPVSTWFNDPHDTELTDLCPFLTDLATVDDVRGVLDGSI